MTQNPIYLTHDDRAKLRLLLSAHSSGKSRFAKLHEELERAVPIEAALLPPAVVRIGSRFEITDLDTDEVSEYTLTFPEQADPARARLSVLAPIGTAVLGYSEGDEIVWETPGGLRRIQLRRVHPPRPSPADPFRVPRSVSPIVPQTTESKAS
jgi:regulator of nucleoside diphosphate kinase